MEREYLTMVKTVRIGPHTVSGGAWGCDLYKFMCIKGGGVTHAITFSVMKKRCQFSTLYTLATSAWPLIQVKSNLAFPIKSSLRAKYPASQCLSLPPETGIAGGA
jgi:hypothetical protein